MKPKLSSTWAAAAALALLPLSLAAQPSLSGMWELSWETPRGSQSFEVSLEQTEMVLTGTAEGPMGEMPLKEGKVDGEKVSFVIEMTMGGRGGGQGRTIEQVFEGVLKDGVIEGEIQMPAMAGRPGGAGGGAGGGRGGMGGGPRTFKMVRAGG
jgi:hypothetical protein